MSLCSSLSYDYDIHKKSLYAEIEARVMKSAWLFILVFGESST